jgi:tripartite-type tricarboxylate transporter receptor subunit TctC
MVVPYAAGGSTDVVARILALRMKASIGQPIIVENVTGASGSIGVGRVARCLGSGKSLKHPKKQSLRRMPQTPQPPPSRPPQIESGGS